MVTLKAINLEIQMTDICTGQKIIAVHLTYLSQETNHCLLSRLH